MSGWLYVHAGMFFFPFPTQWFATILSATEMTKLGHNNPFLFTVWIKAVHTMSCAWISWPHIDRYHHRLISYTSDILTNRKHWLLGNCKQTSKTHIVTCITACYLAWESEWQLFSHERSRLKTTTLYLKII